MKKIIALLTVFAMMFVFASCNNDNNKPEEAQTTAANVEQQETMPSENNGEPATNNGELPSNTENPSETASELVSLAADPSQWTDEQIIEFYKAAAAKVAGVKGFNAALIALLNGDTAPAAALECGCAPAAYLRAIAAARNGDAAGVKKNLETVNKCEKLAARAAKDIEFAQYR